MNPKNPKQAWRWLQTKPPLSELREAFPELWSQVEQELSKSIESRDQTRLHQLLHPAEPQASGKPLDARRGVPPSNLLASTIKQRMAALALREFSLSSVTKAKGGKLRFNLFNGWLAQKLFFKQGFERKPVSLLSFKCLWPLIWQKHYLMPLVEKKGIYCFYSGRLIDELADIIDGRSCLEIAAGDGTLSRFLQARGVHIVATDDHSWANRIDFPATVVRMDAQSALRQYQPRVVLCSWPPAGNAFERRIFQTSSVELYIVIGSELRFATGNWDDYRTQTSFSLEHDRRLSRWVLPPELGTAVFVFKRRHTSQTGEPSSS